jgi:hypothetical protein
MLRHHLLQLEGRLGLGEALDEDGEDDVHHDEAREEGPRDEVGGDSKLETEGYTMMITRLR